MKKILFIVAAGFITTFGYGQENNDANRRDDSSRELVHFGVKIGTNYSNVYDTEGKEFKTDPKFGLAVGAFLSVPIGHYLGFQPEVLFSQKGFKAEGILLNSRYVITRTSNYIDVPLLFALRPVENISLLAGPQYSYLISQKNKFKNGKTSIEQENQFDNDDLRKNTFCFTAGVDLNMQQLVLSGRVGWDLYKNNGNGTSTTPRYKNVWYQLTLGLCL